MLDVFINSALIIDDKPEEVESLKGFLEQKDIWTKHYTPDQLDHMNGPFKNRKLLFLDLQLNEADTTVNNISRIRRYLTKFIGKEFGTYGIVIWTKHAEDVEQLKARVSKDFDAYTSPLFIESLDKTKYIKANSYNGVLGDLETKLKANIASRFFVEWNSIVDKAKDNTIANIFKIETDHTRQEQNLRYILFQIAKNYTGIPTDQLPGHNLTKDTIKGFADMLHYEVIDQATQENFLFNNGNEFFYRHNLDANNNCEYSSGNHLASKVEDKIIRKNGTQLTKPELRNSPGKDNCEATERSVVEIYAHINSRLLIDTQNLNQAILLPGNIYEIVGECPFKLDAADIPPNSRQIVIEVTPPCDFSNSKRGPMSRVIAGYICNYNADNFKAMKIKGESYYKEIWPIFFDDNEAKLFAFDLKYFGTVADADLRDAQKFKLIAKAKDRLFADVLQKLASHTARLGLSVIH